MPCHLGSQSCFVPKRCLRGDCAEDSDYRDWAIVEVEWPASKTDIHAILRLPTKPSSGRVAHPDQVIVVGFPLEHRDIDYENKKLIYHKPTALLARVENGDTDEALVKIVFDSSSEIGDLNGMSGSVVVSERDGEPVLHGILVRASNGFGYYLSAEPIFYAVTTLACDGTKQSEPANVQ